MAGGDVLGEDTTRMAVSVVGCSRDARNLYVEEETSSEGEYAERDAEKKHYQRNYQPHNDCAGMATTRRGKTDWTLLAHDRIDGVR
ncbi:hypothetical protein KM043_017310 [Ampulex compressa]|nr:hypothetical protein KM043_017310 [Ampulex compressa]